ncbi:MAG: hypothetical protein KF691_05470 [Phycisphaeraceae bacterium]|nr:hypothetical protein [Phycisphaeraceae bacterium]
MTVQPSQPAAVGPLSTEHLNEISAAQRRSKKILRAAGIAAFSGWSMVIFAVVTLMFAIMSDWSAWAIGIGLALCGVNELRGGALLRRMEARGARVLGWNQIFLGALIIGYALWSLRSAIGNPALNSMMQGTGDPQIDALASQLTVAVTWGLYGSMAVVGLVVPGLTAIYYFTRGPLVTRFCRETPEWVVEVIRRRG